MSFVVLSDIYVILKELDSFFFAEDFRNTDIFSDYILDPDQVFSGGTTSGTIDLSSFTDLSETYTFTDLVNSPDWDLEDYIISRKISIAEERRLEDVVGKDWKKKMVLVKQ